MPGLILQFLLVVAASLFSVGPATAETLESRTSAVAGVTVKVSPRYQGGDAWEFEITLDTHSRDLGDDLARSVVLITENGEFTPLGWSGDPPGGHHRKGILGFKATIPPREALRLRVHLAGEAQARVFEWQRR